MSNLPTKLCFVDIETTGSSLFRSRIIEIGILRVENGQVVQTFRSLVNPEQSLPEEITLLTGITPAELESAPTFSEIADQVFAILDEAVFVAHNVRFDYSFMKQELRRVGYQFSPKQMCTVKLSRKLYPQERHHNLDILIQRFNLVCPSRHRAFEDADCLWQFYQIINKQFAEEELLAALETIMKQPTRPIKLEQSVLDNLPETAGVYIFYGQNDCVLYVGKSVNLRDRVLSHFASDHSSTKELQLAQLVERVETIQTAGELGALLKEAELIKTLLPLYNRRLRRLQKMMAVKQIKDRDGYDSIKIETISEINPDEVSEIIAIFPSAKRAKSWLTQMNKDYDLCANKLQLESTSGGCFGYRLGRCQGACKGLESTVKYNLKFQLAFTSHRFKSWPFPGTIVIKEQCPFTDRLDHFLVDKWCLMGSFDPSGQTPKAKTSSFDLDTYKILVKYLKQPSAWRKIETQVDTQKIEFDNSGMMLVNDLINDSDVSYEPVSESA